MTIQNSIQAIQSSFDLFGEHPEDVIHPLEYASEALGTLEEIFRTIKQEAIDSKDLRVKRLAAAGESVINDALTYIDGRYSEMDEHLRSFMVNSKPDDIEEPSHA